MRIRDVKGRALWLQSKYLSAAARKYRRIDEQCRQNKSFKVPDHIRIEMLPPAPEEMVQ